MNVNSRDDLEVLFHYAGSEISTAVLLKIQVFSVLCSFVVWVVSGVSKYRSVFAFGKFIGLFYPKEFYRILRKVKKYFHNDKE